jgi:hypothetical protein
MQAGLAHTLLARRMLPLGGLLRTLRCLTPPAPLLSPSARPPYVAALLALLLQLALDPGVGQAQPILQRGARGGTRRVEAGG